MPRRKDEDASLAKLRGRIQREAPYIGIKPYSHNIVRLVLADIQDKYSRAEANRAVRDFGLQSKGFNQESEE